MASSAQIASSSIDATQTISAGGRLVATDGRQLPLVGTRLEARARGGLAHVVLEQRFINAHDIASRLISAKHHPGPQAARRLPREERRQPRAGGEMNTPDQTRLLIEEAAGAYRPTRDGGVGSHPAWHDLDAAAREQAFDLAVANRELEAALDPKGLSTTAHAVIDRIRAAER